MTRTLAALAACLLAAPAAADEVVVKAAAVHTMAGPPLRPGAVRVKGGQVVEVARAVTAPAGVRVVDLGEGVLLPGLIDAYTTAGLEGGLSESTAEVTPDFRVADALDFADKELRQLPADGVTTVAVVPGTENVIAGRSAVIKTAGDPAKRTVTADHALVLTMSSDPAGGNSARNRPDSIYNRQPTNRMGVVWALRDAFARPDRLPVVREVVVGKRPAVCVSRTDADITAALRLKADYRLPLVLAGGQEAYKLRAELASARVGVLLGPLSSAAGNGVENTETVLNLAGSLHEAGVPVALTGGKLLDQARLAVRFGMPRDAALAAVTATPAKLLNLGDRLGTIAPGRDADLVALSADPFDLSAAVRWTMTDGVIRAEEP